MEKSKNRKGIIIAAAALLVLAAVFAGVYFLAIEKPVSGEKDITVEIIHSDKTVKSFGITTNAEYLGQALEGKDFVQGTKSAMGLLVTTADGEATDSAKQEWWCLTQDGVSLTTGVDVTPIKDGDKFEFTFTVGW